ncbi:MAG: hypothetical protein JJT94_01715 [Bernardetiaceae bacterium]|nr:hypothetical protein [Bernardetiaceae bacterium]
MQNLTLPIVDNTYMKRSKSLSLSMALIGSGAYLLELTLLWGFFPTALATVMEPFLIAIIILYTLYELFYPLVEKPPKDMGTLELQDTQLIVNKPNGEREAFDLYHTRFMRFFYNGHYSDPFTGTGNNGSDNFVEFVYKGKFKRFRIHFSNYKDTQAFRKLLSSWYEQGFDFKEFTNKQRSTLLEVEQDGKKYVLDAPQFNFEDIKRQ